jgi:hypothetical protein
MNFKNRSELKMLATPKCLTLGEIVLSHVYHMFTMLFIEIVIIADYAKNDLK